MPSIASGCILTILTIGTLIYLAWPKVDEDKGMLIAHLDLEKGTVNLSPKRYKTWWTVLMEWLPQSMFSGGVGMIIGFTLGWIKFS